MRAHGGIRSVVLVALLLLGLAVACAGGSTSADPDLDTDGDGLKDVDEERDGTDKDRADTDGDGVDDGDEVDDGTDPTDPDDFTPPPEEDDEPPADDPEPPDDPDPPADDGACDESATDPCIASIDDSQTCHNFDDAGGFSDERVFGQVFGTSGTGNVALTFAVIENQASAGPEERIAQGSYNATGQFVALVPLFGAGEVIQLTGADFGQGPLDPSTLPDFTFTVTPLDDAGSQCEALAN